MIKSILLSLVLLLGSLQITYAQLNIQIIGGDLTVCENETVSLNHSVVSGSPISFSWASAVATFSSSTSGTTQATISDSGIVVLTTSDGSTSFSDTIQVNAKPLPEIKLGSDESVCCDAGQLVLNFKIEEPKGVPSTGKWSCTEFPYLVKNNLFNVDSGCSEIGIAQARRTFFAVYDYQDPSSLCSNSDSIEIQVNKLPRLVLRAIDKCQNADSVGLDDEVVISPANLALGTSEWKCLECNGNDFSKMLENKGHDFAPDYWLNIGKANYTLQNHDKDTVTLELSFTNQLGCRAKDTVDIRIWRVPEVKFSDNRDLCWDEGEIALNDFTRVNLKGGSWYCADSAGFSPCIDIGGILGDTINTLNSTFRDTSQRWLMRYNYHNGNGCPADHYLPIRVNPLPLINLTTPSPNQFCEGSPPITLEAAPVGGLCTNLRDPLSITSGNQYNPGTAQILNQFTTIFYDYTSPITGCYNRDSIKVRTDKLAVITPISDTTFCREQGQMQIIVPYNLEAKDADNISWLAANTFGNAFRASTSRYSETQDETLTLTLQNAKSDTFRIVIFAESSSAYCNSVDDFFDVIVHPIPEGSIISSTPNGCNPVTIDLDIKINNDVNLATSTYDWDLGDGGSATSQTPSARFTNDGTNDISVILTSEHGCEATLSSSVDVYPIPRAKFTPNPNNNATLDLPRFTFNNESSVSSIFLSSITENRWNFGETTTKADTSNATSPTYFYPKAKASYQVILYTTTNYGCIDSFSYPVHVGKPEAVSISEIDSNASFAIYPNPSTGSFYMKSEQPVEIEITNSLGQLVPYTQNGEQFQVQQKGLLFVRITDETSGYSLVKRLLIQ